MPESDFVVALDRYGKVAEQGTFSSLRRSGGYVESLDIPSHCSNDEEAASSEFNNAEEETSSASKSEQTEEAIDPPSDRSVFAYYFRAIRAHNMTILTTLILVQGVIAAFRCKSAAGKLNMF